MCECVRDNLRHRTESAAGSACSGLRVRASVRSGDGPEIFAGMTELMLLELSLLIEIAWDPLNWKIWFEEAVGEVGVLRKPSCVSWPLVSPSKRCELRVRISGAARDAPQIGPGEDQVLSRSG